MEEKIKSIMVNIFQIEKSSIYSHSSPDNINTWDSIGHLNLITSLEEEFGISFTEEQIVQMLNFELVVEITKEAVK